MHDEMIAAFAQKLGLTEAELNTRLSNGESMAQVAASKRFAFEQSCALMLAVRSQVLDQANSKGIILEVEIQPDLPEIQLDIDRITQVLNNLIGNALRYTPEGGTIRVQAQSMPDRGAQVMTVSVTDTSPGIASEALPFVFNRFFREDKSRTRTSGGSGLGLVIVKQLVEAHGSQVKAKSPIFKRGMEPGYGTCISFTLPI